ncbi:TetR/AcrR family transcriptional regulator [Christensenellaceae bacterium OttesenSCG-928-L17]|nr:TetR/AcrR family transcriptional regulator [Christensenellaceae bacterium OttesenSCG-928-L17]
MLNKPYSDKEQAILASTVQLMRDGVDIAQMKVADIAAAANVGKGTVYEYFQSKDEIIQCAIAYGTQNWLEGAQADISSVDTFDEKMATLVDWLYDSARERHMLFQIQKGAHPSNPPVFITIVQEKVTELLADILSTGLREKRFELSDPVYTAFALVYLLLGYAVLRFINTEINPEVQSKESILRMVYTLLEVK